MDNRELLVEGAKSFGIDLKSRQTDQFFRYFQLLVEWNQRMNLTAIVEEKEVVIKHFLDCMSGAPILRRFSNPRVADIGTGAGFPGIPLKIVFPEAPFVLIDSLQKRVGFLREVVDQLGLTGIELIHGRAEELAHEEKYREQFDVVVSRAVASLPVLLDYSLGYVKTHGLFVAYKGPALEEELADSQRALKTLKGVVESASPTEIPFGDYSHTIAVIRKEGVLPRTYPRSQAKIKKMPL